MANKYTVMSEEAIRYMCGLIRDVVSLPSEIISNINLADNLTFSNTYIKDLVEQCLIDAKDYADLICGSLIKLTCKKTTTQPTLDNSELNIIYLFSSDGNAPYEQYLKISDTELIDMGSTSINLNDYLTVTDAVNTYAKKVDLDTLTTEVTNIKSDFTTHSSDTDIHTSATEKASYVKKTDIVDNLTSTDTDKPLSAKQGKVLNDKKVDKTDITTTINSTSTDTQVPTAKSIYYNCIEGIELSQRIIDSYGTKILKYPLGIWRIRGDDLASKFTDLPVKTSGRIEITSIEADTNKNPLDNSWSYRVYNFENYTRENYIRKIVSSNTAGVFSYDTGWRKVCTTSVADVALTRIPTNENKTNYEIVNNNNGSSYIVRDGICAVSLCIKCNSVSAGWIDCFNAMPRPYLSYGIHFSVSNMYNTDAKPIFVKVVGNMLQVRQGSVTSGMNNYYISFSYPVAES